MAHRILGISCLFHDAAACLVEDGAIVAAAQEERFSRRKHDPDFPFHAINYGLEEGRCDDHEIDLVVFYEKPALVLDRLAHDVIGAPDEDAARHRLHRIASSWSEGKLDVEELIRRAMPGFRGPVLYSEHHVSHAASAFYPSPFEEAAILTVDGVGEWATALLGLGRGRDISLMKEMRYPHSVGLLYTAFTAYAGFKANSGEYKLMGLAPYGRPIYLDLIRERVVDVKADGSIELNLDLFDFATGDRMFSDRLGALLGHPPRRPEAPLTTFYMDLAASVQRVTEEIVLSMAAHLRRETCARALCLAGGVALNCVANGKILRSRLYDDIWIQPAAGDAGGAVGAALAGWHLYLGQPRRAPAGDGMRGALLGPAYSSDEIRDVLDTYGFPYDVIPDEDLAETIAELVASGRIVGLFQGRMEFGPRALGNRSIIGDARRQDTQTVMNRRIKFRESFRPFAPAVLRERVAEWFDLDADAPYMLITADVRADKRRPFEDPGGDDVLERLAVPRSVIPAVTHLDGSARVQTVHRDLHPLLHRIIEAFERLTGVPVVVNTSFNVRGEPIVCTPMDAYRCMMRTAIDCVVMENVLVWRDKQPAWPEPPPSDDGEGLD